MRIVCSIGLLLPWFVPQIVFGQPSGDAGTRVDGKLGQPAVTSLIAASRQCTAALSKLTLSYYAIYQPDLKPASTHRIYESPDEVLVEGVGKYAFAISANGGFFVAVSPDAKGYSVRHIATNGQLESSPSTRYSFEDKCAMSGRGLHPHGGPGSRLMTTATLLDDPNLVLKSTKILQGGLIEIKYTKSPPPGLPNALGEIGTVKVDPALYGVIRELDLQILSKPTGEHHEVREYFPPTEKIPYPLLKQIVTTDEINRIKPQKYSTKLIFSDYKLEPVPAEKLKLSYWQDLPDALLAPERKTGHWVYALVAGVVALAAGAVYFARRSRAEGAA